MSEQTELFPIDQYTDRLYFNDTSTRTKRPNQKGAIPQREVPKPRIQTRTKEPKL